MENHIPRCQTYRTTVVPNEISKKRTNIQESVGQNGTKHFRDNQLQSQEFPYRLS